jgi:hypothetical protein
MSISFKDQSNSPPLPSAVARDVAPRGKTLGYTRCRFVLELAKLVELRCSANMELAAEVAEHFGVVALFAVSQVDG